MMQHEWHLVENLLPALLTPNHQTRVRCKLAIDWVISSSPMEMHYHATQIIPPIGSIPLVLMALPHARILNSRCFIANIPNPLCALQTLTPLKLLNSYIGLPANLLLLSLRQP